jgi:hypothetical protein
MHGGHGYSVGWVGFGSGVNTEAWRGYGATLSPFLVSFGVYGSILNPPFFHATHVNYPYITTETCVMEYSHLTSVDF